MRLQGGFALYLIPLYQFSSFFAYFSTVVPFANPLSVGISTLVIISNNCLDASSILYGTLDWDIRVMFLLSEMIASNEWENARSLSSLLWSNDVLWFLTGIFEPLTTMFLSESLSKFPILDVKSSFQENDVSKWKRKSRVFYPFGSRTAEFLLLQDSFYDLIVDY